MKNDRNRWDNQYGSDRRSYNDDNNSEWRPASYRHTDDADYQNESYGYRPGSRYRQQSSYGQNSGYGSSYGAGNRSGQRSDYGTGYRSSYGSGGYQSGRRQESNYGGYQDYQRSGSNYQSGNSYRNDPFDSDNDYRGSRYNRSGVGYRDEDSYSHVGYNRNYHRDAARDRAAEYRQDSDYNRGDRNFWDKAGDEIASWFGDDDARRRRRMDDWEDSDYSRASYRGKGPKNYKRSDSRIEEDINDRLSDDWHLDASDVEVKVENGDVILSGTVRDRAAKRHAEDLAERVSGVGNVENRIRVEKASSGLNNVWGTSAAAAGTSAGVSSNTGTTTGTARTKR